MQLLNRLIMSLSDNPKQVKDAGDRLAKSVKAKSDALIALNHEQVNILRSEQARLPEEREKQRLKCQVKGEKKLQRKSLKYRFSAMLLSYSSLILSVSGASGSNALLHIGKTLTNPFAIAIFVLQTTLLGYYASESQVRQLYKGTHRKMAMFQYMIIAVSIYCNYIYLNMLIGEPAICMVLAVAFDFGSIAFSQLATVVKYRMIDLDEGNPSILYQLFVVLTHPITNAISNKYEAIMQEQKPKVTSSVYAGSEDFDAEQEKTKAQENYDSVMKQIANMKSGEVVNKDTFGLSQYDWKNVRERLDNNNIVECKNKKTYIL